MIGDILCVQQNKNISETEDIFQSAQNILYSTFKSQLHLNDAIAASLYKIKKGMFDVIYVQSTEGAQELTVDALELYKDLLRKEGLLVATMIISDEPKQINTQKSELIADTINGVGKSFKLLALEDLESVEQNSFLTWSFVAQKNS